MRRLFPWLLVFLVAAGAGLGAVLGLAQKSSSQTPPQWVANVLHATKDRGAHTSPTPR